MKPVDELLIARHSSGLRLVLSPNMKGDMCIWIDLPQMGHFKGVQRLVCRWSNRHRLAKWLRETADKLEKS